MKAAVMAGALAAAALVAAAQGRESYQLSMTVRDFVPSGCLPASEFKEAWARPDERYGLQDRYFDDPYEPLRDNSLSLRLLQVYDQEVLNSVTSPEYCPYFAAQHAREVSGHPDFEPPTPLIAEGPQTCWVGGERVAACSGIEDSVAPALGPRDSGVPVVRACSEDGLARCSNASAGEGLYPASRAGYFASWFDDDPRYNKRVGRRIVARRDPQGAFVFGAPGEAFAPLDGYRDTVSQETYPLAEDAPVWPNVLGEAEGPPSKHLFTTEIHGYFEYRRGRSELEVGGSDDLWVFINGKIAVELSGIHAEMSARINVSDYEVSLGLEEAGVYPVSLFHAHRSWSTTAALYFRTDLAPPCGSPEASTRVFDLTGVAGSASLELSDGADFDVGRATLTLGKPGNADGAAVQALGSPLPVLAGFEAAVRFRLSQEGGPSTFAFAIVGIHRVVVTIEHCASRAAGCGAAPGSITIEQRLSSSAGPGRVLAQAPIWRSLRTGNESHWMRVEFMHSAPHWLQVFIDDSLFLRAEVTNLRSLLGSSLVRMGVVATGPAPAEVSGWTVALVQPDPALSAVEDGPEEGVAVQDPLLLVADGKAQAGYTVQTFDDCGHEMSVGGHASMFTGLFVSEDAVDSEPVPATIVDNGDGTYAAVLVTQEPGTYSLYLCAGGDLQTTETSAGLAVEPAVGTKWFFSAKRAVRAEAASGAGAGLSNAELMAITTASAVGASLLGVAALVCFMRRRRRKQRLGGGNGGDEMGLGFGGWVDARKPRAVSNDVELSVSSVSLDRGSGASESEPRRPTSRPSRLAAGDDATPPVPRALKRPTPPTLPSETSVVPPPKASEARGQRRGASRGASRGAGRNRFRMSSMFTMRRKNFSVETDPRDKFIFSYDMDDVVSSTGGGRADAADDEEGYV